MLKCAINCWYSRKPVEEEGNKSVSPEYPSETGKVTELKTKEDNHMQKEDVTPKKASPPVYISPYVTVSRGKNSTRKEDVEERGDIAKNRSPLAGAAYFMHLLNEQVDRLQEICRQWENYKVRKTFLRFMTSSQKEIKIATLLIPEL